MSIVTFHDRIQKFFNKKQKINTNRLPHLKNSSWSEAKKKALNIKVSPGWAVYFVREEGFIDHTAIIINQETGLLNLKEAVLLNALPSPLGHGVGPLTNSEIDKSGLRVITAVDYVENYPENYYKKIFVGPPPEVKVDAVNKAGLIAEEFAKAGVIDKKPVVYSFYNVPIIKKYFVSYFNSVNFKVTVERTKKLKQSVVSFYCGGLVAEIWRRAGINDIPENRFLSLHGPTSFSLFKWSKNGKSIMNGLSW